MGSSSSYRAVKLGGSCGTVRVCWLAWRYTSSQVDWEARTREKLKVSGPEAGLLPFPSLSLNSPSVEKHSHCQEGSPSQNVPVTLLSQENSYCGRLSPCYFSASPRAQAWPPLPGEQNSLKFEYRLLRHWHHLWPCLSSYKSCMSLSTGCRALLHVPAICPNLGYLSAWEQLGFFGDHRNWLCLA